MSESEPIGERLRAARERLGLGVVQAAERMLVDTSVIEALEAGNYAQLGPPVFVRGHLHRYAQMLGEPEEPLMAQYSALQESQLSPDLMVAPREVSQSHGEALLRWPLILGVGLVVLAVLLWFGLSARAVS